MQESSMLLAGPFSAAASTCRAGISAPAPAETRPRKPRRVASFMRASEDMAWPYSISPAWQQSDGDVRIRHERLTSVSAKRQPYCRTKWHMMSHAVANTYSRCDHKSLSCTNAFHRGGV